MFNKKIVVLIQCHEDGIIANIDQASAWLGFQKIDSMFNIKVELISMQKLMMMNKIDLHNYIKSKYDYYHPDSHVIIPFGNINFTRRIAYLTDVKLPEIPKIPSELFEETQDYQNEMFGRKIIPNVKLDDIFYDNEPFLNKHNLNYTVVKPMKMKEISVFKMLKGEDCSCPHYNLDAICYVESHKDMYSEYRVYIVDNVIKGICNYANLKEGLIMPFDYKRILAFSNIIKGYYPNMNTFSFDVFVGKDELIPCDDYGPPMFNNTYFLEMHDFWGIGNYGLFPEDFAQGLMKRWIDILGDGK